MGSGRHNLTCPGFMEHIFGCATTRRKPPLEGQVYQTVTNLDSYDGASGRFDTLDPSEAQVTTSKVAGKFGVHKVVIDLDLPAQLVASTTPGHYHLYIDKEIPAHEFFALLEALADAGLIEPGYLGASEARGYTSVRLPWVRKPEPEERSAIGRSVY